MRALRATIGFLLVLVPPYLAAGAFVFPSIDEDQRWGPIDQDSFGTLIDPALAPEDSDRGSLPAPLRPTADLAGDALAQRYEELLEGGFYTQAVDVAEAMVDAARRQHGPRNLEYAYALSDLAAAHHHDGQYQQALEDMRRSIVILRDQLGVLHPDLIGPYAYLGMSQQALGHHREAVDSLSRAQGLTHRHLGATNLEQVKLLHAKAESWDAMGEYWEAEQLLRAVLKLNRQHYGADDPRALPALLTLAAWLRDIGEFNDALSLYRQTLRELAADNGEDTPAMIGTMQQMALTYLLRGDHQVDRGLRLQRRIAALTERYPNSFTAAERIRAHLDLGDWLTLFDRHRKARREYVMAWELSRADEAREDWDALFAVPQLIFAGPNISLDSLGYQWVDKFAYADFVFDVRDNGQPAKIRLNGANLHTTNIREALALMRYARFRPALAEGRPARVSGYRMRRIYNTEAPPDYGVVSLGGVSPRR